MLVQKYLYEIYNTEDNTEKMSRYQWGHLRGRRHLRESNGGIAIAQDERGRLGRLQADTELLHKTKGQGAIEPRRDLQR